MNPRLVAVSGPFEGRSFPLGDQTFKIGRHKSNDLRLPYVEVSRYHCVLRRDSGQFVVEDLGSRHGTFVNSRPVGKSRLEHSDLVTVGATALLFLLDDSTSSGERLVPVDSRVATTLHKKHDDVLYLDSERVDAALPAQARVARHLGVLVRISTTLQESLLDLDELAERLLGALFEVTPAERGAVLLREPAVDKLRPAALRQRGGDEHFEISRTVIEKVLAERVALCCEDVAEEPEMAAAESARSAGLRALLSAPLVGHDDVLGVLYLDTRRRRASFGEHDLELIVAIAAIASLALENGYHLRWLRRENRRLADENLRHDMIGESAAMRRVLELIARVARSDATVLVRGESGTGKELAAQAVHRSSPRAEGPFVAVNCATLSQTLLESELFGHEKGAFTGAVARKVGKLEVADGGTLFLDEVGEIPPVLQARLLRVIQEREFERVGGTRTIPVDLRLVAATNRDLEAMIADGAFREDLYYRLKVVTLTLPPLRDRRDDVPLLASHFAARHGRQLGRRVGISPAARRHLLAYDWPGNVRELGNVIERAVVLGQDDVIRPEDLPDEVLDSVGEASSGFHAAMTEAKKRLVLDTYKKSGGDYARTAELLDIHVNSLHRMIKNLGLKPRLGR